MKETKEKGMLASVFTFIFCYLILLGVIFSIIVINDLEGWPDFIVKNTAGMVILAVCTLLLCGIILYYYFFEDKLFLKSPKNIVLIFSLMVFCILLDYGFGFFSIYARPFMLFAILCVFLFNRRQAILLNFVFCILTFVIDIYTNTFTDGVYINEMYFSLMLNFVCGTFAVFLVGGVKTRFGVLLTGFAVMAVSAVVLFLLEVPKIETIGLEILRLIGFGVLGSTVSVVAAVAFLPLFETMFGRLTVFKLRELTRTDSPILKRLSVEAPGTFNHSFMVAQLAEACALAIGANSELARAASYYHDVGKLKKPECFTENQKEYNIHDELTPELSVEIIRSHTRDGYDMLQSMHMPQLFADIAIQHHGTLPIKSFYGKALRLSGGYANIEDYSYEGPTPQTKIAAIVMIADASEAAVRSLSDRSTEKVDALIHSIIQERIDLGQFVDCDVTMKDLTVIRKTLVSALAGVYHKRVKYPRITFNRDGTVTDKEKK